MYIDVHNYTLYGGYTCILLIFTGIEFKYDNFRTLKQKLL